MSNSPETTLVLGIGNLLLGDEGVGVHAIRALEASGPLPAPVQLLDGGTGAMGLLAPMLEADRILLVDATADGAAPGTLRELRPRFARDYPPTLTAHDIGLKDLLDAFHLLGREPDVTLFTVSIDLPQPMAVELSPAVASALPGLVLALRRTLEACTVP